MEQVNTTQQFYERVVAISEHFNRNLFDGDLRCPLLTLKRGSRSLANFVASQWRSPDGEATAEIRLDPALFAQHTWLRLMQCIAEQLCHHWQHVHGSPSRPGYHNKEWADKLESIGLMPSSTGVPGGRRTGQIMSSYPIVGGRFLAACEQLAAGELQLPLTGTWTEYPEPDASAPLNLARGVANRLLSPVGSASSSVDAKVAIEKRERKRKQKYVCPRCGVSVWGRSGLQLDCRACDLRLREATLSCRNSEPAIQT